MEIIGFLLIGLIAGWLATTLMRSGGIGLAGNLVIGGIGTFVGGFLSGLIGFQAVGLIGHIITATVGAAVLLAATDLMRVRKPEDREVESGSISHLMSNEKTRRSGSRSWFKNTFLLKTLAYMGDKIVSIIVIILSSLIVAWFK